jgi:hypothetical protein
MRSGAGVSVCRNSKGSGEERVASWERERKGRERAGMKRYEKGQKARVHTSRYMPRHCEVNLQSVSAALEVKKKVRRGMHL